MGLNHRLPLTGDGDSTVQATKDATGPTRLLWLILYDSRPMAPAAAAARAYASVVALGAPGAPDLARPARRAAHTPLGEMQAYRGRFFLRHR